VPGARLVTTTIEHASVRETARMLAEAGAKLTEVPVDGDGCVGADAVIGAVDSSTALVSVGLANGEVGSIAPVAEIAAGVAGRGLLVHSDAAQAVGRLPVDVAALDVDLLSLSAHKMGGPPGVGALWIRRGVSLRAQLTGGPQERERRAGTENVAAIVGIGVAARLARADDAVATGRLIDRLWSGLRRSVPDVVRNGPAVGPRLPNTLNVSVPGCAAESLLILLDLAGVAVSSGSACAAGAAEPSHVLLAMGRDEESARSGLRFSVGPSTRLEDVDRVLGVFPALVAQVRAGVAA
jgi:cysteine desulfurase